MLMRRIICSCSFRWRIIFFALAIIFINFDVHACHGIQSNIWLWNCVFLFFAGTDLCRYFLLVPLPRLLSWRSWGNIECTEFLGFPRLFSPVNVPSLQSLHFLCLLFWFNKVTQVDDWNSESCHSYLSNVFE